MKIEINPEEMKAKKLAVLVPMYGGMCSGMFMKSCLDIQMLAAQYGVETKFSFLMNESLVQRARNYLVDEFLHRTDCTHMMFIDADITFNAIDVIAMLALDKEIIGGGYSKKSLNFGRLHNAIKRNPELPAAEYESLLGDIVFNPVKGTENFKVTEPLEVMDLGTGFMMIRRDVFTKYQEAHPEQMYLPDHQTTNFDGSREICAFFDCVIDDKTKRYLSEDYFFTQKCRELGIKTWLCPWIQLGHMGSYIFKSDLNSVAKNLGHL
jgi:hypothetical protein